MDSKRILELAGQTGVNYITNDGDISVTEAWLERFATLIESEVLGDAEPVAYIGTDGSLGWLKKPEALYNKAIPLYTHPATAVVKQLVEALETLFDACLIVQSPDGVFYTKHPQQEQMEKAKAALAAAKEAGV
jgi:hypothetical protein